MKREQGIDLLRVISCIFVVGLHTLMPGQGIINRIFSVSGAVCIPLFWMASGFGIGLKQKVTMKYTMKKILRILLVCFTWEFCHAMVMFVLTGNMRNFISSYLLDFVQKGLFFHFWFMGTMIILYLLAPVVINIAAQNKIKILIIVLMVLNLLLDVLSYRGMSAFLKIPSSARVWTYELYFVLGYAAAKNKDKIRAYRMQMNRIITAAAGMFAMILMCVWISYVKDSIDPTRGYGDFHMSIPVIIASATVFYAIGFSDIRGKWIGRLIGLVMGIYIIHPFVLAVLDKILPAFTSGGSALNLLFWLLTTASSAVATLIMTKIPLVKEMVRL